jgi:anti-sigma B factor antagonist
MATDGGTCTLAVAGELDMANADTLRKALDDAAAEEVVLDMSQLEFIDSTGIALLVAAHHRRNRDGRTGFRLVGSESAAVRRVMSVTGLDRKLPFSAAGGQVPQP